MIKENFDWRIAIDKYYPADSKVRGILLQHSRSVAELSLALNARNNLGLDPEVVETAAMLHDIGIIATDAPGIDCYGREPYLAHGAVGADMLRAINAPEIYACVAERHTGAGLTAEEITESALPLPADRVYMPQTDLERLICYADCFYSKGGDYKIKSLERVRKSMKRFGITVLARFDALVASFGLPKEI